MSNHPVLDRSLFSYEVKDCIRHNLNRREHYAIFASLFICCHWIYHVCAPIQLSLRAPNPNHFIRWGEVFVLRLQQLCHNTSHLSHTYRQELASDHRSSLNAAQTWTQLKSHKHVCSWLQLFSSHMQYGRIRWDGNLTAACASILEVVVDMKHCTRSYLLILFPSSV